MIGLSQSDPFFLIFLVMSHFRQTLTKGKTSIKTIAQTQPIIKL